jgi:UDPglucose 6-dehydrogenase
VLVKRVRDRFGADLRGLSFGVWGLSFKPDTDDMRDAPSLTIVRELLAAGASIRAFDPVARPDVERLWGAGAAVSLVETAADAAVDASALLVVTEWREFRSPDFADLRSRMREPVLFDGRNLFDPQLLAAFGFEYAGIGRAPQLQPGPADDAQALAA